MYRYSTSMYSCAMRIHLCTWYKTAYTTCSNVINHMYICDRPNFILTHAFCKS